MKYQCPSLLPHVLLTLVFGDTTEPAEGEGLGGGGSWSLHFSNLQKDYLFTKTIKLDSLTMFLRIWITSDLDLGSKIALVL